MLFKYTDWLMIYSKMRFYKVIFIALWAVAVFGCAGAGGEADQKSSSPVNTLEAYATAFKKKDITSMKLLLSQGSLKTAEQQARERGVTVDEVVKNETLFTENQTKAAYRNQKIEGNRATVEIRNAVNSWDTVAFVLEDGVWKIDKQSMIDKMQQDMEQDMKRLEEEINKGRVP